MPTELQSHSLGGAATGSQVFPSSSEVSELIASWFHGVYYF